MIFLSQDKVSSKKHNYNFRSGLFLIESMLFLVSQGIGLYVGYALFKLGYTPSAETNSSVIIFLLTFLIATAAIVSMLKFFKGKFLFQFLLAFLIFAGSETVFSVFVPDLIAIVLSGVVVFLRFKFQNVLSQNIAMVFAISGIGATLGVFLSIRAVLIILAVLSVYDVVAVYRTKHMVSMFRGLVDRGVPFSIVVPDKLKNIHSSVLTAKPGKGGFLMLGTGDLTFPLVFSVSALNAFGILSAVSVIFGAFLGLFFIHILLLKKKKGAIPALPPIILFSLIFFLISILL